MTTGQFLVTEQSGADATAAALTELYKFDPAEVLPGPEVRSDDDFLDEVRERTDASLSLHTTEAFAPGRARHRVREQFGAETLESVGIADAEAAVRAAGAVISYVDETGAGVLASMTRLQSFDESAYVDLDATTQRNLELTETMQGDRDGSLFSTVDHTVTSAGGRLLREWLQRPRRSRGELTRRQSAVAALAEAAMARDQLRETLGDAYDLERLASKAASGSADARDLRAVQETLALLPAVGELIAETERLAESPLAGSLTGRTARPPRNSPPTSTRRSSRTRRGRSRRAGLSAGIRPRADEIIESHESALAWIEELPEREKRKTGITHLSVDRNKTDGYYIQVGKSETDQVPDTYEQIKTLKNSERYVVDELEDKEREILRLEERRHEMEREIFERLRDRVAARAEVLQETGRALAECDALASLAAHAVRNDWTRPELTDGRELTVQQGRHPVVEQTTQFVPNDLRMDEDRQFLIVTGPNMSGKSTYMRQAALITLLAQVGSFVPARSARVGLVDGIYTRVGALDELAQGRSTFMVEMQELSNILHSAGEDSLVILDEVGRGTATYDGISIAWAATEYLANRIQAKTLFATHYHELTALGEELPTVENVHVAADESDGDVTFLRTVRDGPTNRSYGIHVADLAGVPEPVVDRSRDVLNRLREEKAIEVQGSERSDGSDTEQVVFDLGSGELVTEGAGSTQQQVATDGSQIEAPASDSDGRPLDPETEAVLDELGDIDVNETPPVELMAKVQNWQEQLGESDADGS
ncbi:DNA mismatch repair protein MutS [Halosimplex aquaticum]